MSNSYYQYFKEMWISILNRQYHQGTISEKRTIKDNVFKNVHLTDKQKERVWELIIS